MFVEIGSRRIFMERSGSGDAVVVGVSGSFGTSEIWRPPFGFLSESCRTVAYDHLGTGLTEAPAGAVTFERQVDLLGEIVEVVADGHRCLLAGDSSMTAVAIEAAFRWPERFAGMVLVSGGLDFAPTEPVERFVEGLRHAFGPTIDGFVRLAVPEDETGDHQRWLKAIIERTGGDRAAALVESFYEVDVRPRLPRIEIPTVVIHGELDRMPTTPLAASEEIAETIPDARLVVLPGTGHVPTLTEPRAVADEIETLLRT